MILDLQRELSSLEANLNKYKEYVKCTENMGFLKVIGALK